MYNQQRRLPVYLLLDCSGSMLGEPIEAVRQGVSSMLSELRGDPQTAVRTEISLLTFSSRARLHTPLTPLSDFDMPAISAEGGTAMGEALLLLCERVREEITPRDFRPLCFLLTDGSPSDTAAFEQAVRTLPSAQLGGLAACAAGSKAKTDCLRRLTDNVVILNTVSAGDLARFFAQVSMVIRASADYADQPDFDSLIRGTLMVN